MSVKERVGRIGRWVKYYWMWIACGIIAFGVGGVTYYCLPLAEGDAPLYLLSALSQGLAAIFTLIFAITIFAAQMMRKFTAMDKMIDKWTIVLMLIFTIGIILPLIQLKTDKNLLLGLSLIRTADLSFSIDLAVATFCVLSIIPYLKKVNRTMKYEGGIPKLKEEASEATDSGHKETASHKINELAELGESAATDIHRSHELQTIKVIRELRNIGIGVAEKEWERQTKDVLVGLKKIGLKAVEKELVGEEPKELGILAVGRVFSATKEVLEALTEVGIKAADKTLMKSEEAEDSVASWAIDGLIEIGDKAYKKDNSKFKEVSRDSMTCLWILGAFVQKYLPDHAKNMAMNLKESDKRVIQDLFEEEYNNAEEYAKKAYPALIGDLKTFGRAYKSPPIHR